MKKPRPKNIKLPSIVACKRYQKCSISLLWKVTNWVNIIMRIDYKYHFAKIEGENEIRFREKNVANLDNRWSCGSCRKCSFLEVPARREPHTHCQHPTTHSTHPTSTQFNHLVSSQSHTAPPPPPPPRTHYTTPISQPSPFHKHPTSPPYPIHLPRVVQP